MGIRLTGISTPVIGASWEFTDKLQKPEARTLIPDEKIKVFISSKCGVPKYDRVRAALKQAIENTQLAIAYVFEEKGPSTLSAGNHYTWALEDSDICIFLIDNADEIPPGVQAQIDTVKRMNMKALYYFCDETSKEQTALEQSLMGSQHAKSKRVHTFDELSHDGAKSLIDDIVSVYHNYCSGRIGVLQAATPDQIRAVDVVGTEKYPVLTIPKMALRNIDRCRNRLLQFLIGYPRKSNMDEKEKTSDFDDWGIQFLSVLLEGESIKKFNASMYLDFLQTQQDVHYHSVVKIRWQAIQSYYMDDIDKCMNYLDEALQLAKETTQPEWIITDILIDIRNMHWVQCAAQNEYSEPSAQKELTESRAEVYYPILDRICESLHSNCLTGLYEQKTASPFTVTFGNELDEYGVLLASSLVVAMYNASLTHILRLYNRLRDCAFYFSCKYDNWAFKLNLYKLTIFCGKGNELKNLRDTFPDILNTISADDAAAIMAFCRNCPIRHQRLGYQLLALGEIGYFLSDNDFEAYQQHLVNNITAWLDDNNLTLAIGSSIFRCLEGISHRVSQDILAEICCKFIEYHYSRWYTDMFPFIARCLQLNKMSVERAKTLLLCIGQLLEDEEEHKQIACAPALLCVLRNQNTELTEELDKQISIHLPVFYSGIYMTETMLRHEEDKTRLAEEYINNIERQNEKQGQNGAYTLYSLRSIATLRNYLVYDNWVLDQNVMDRMIAVVADTLLVSREMISVKIDAISLLICIVLKCPGDYQRNKHIFDMIYEKHEQVESQVHQTLASNVDGLSVKIGLQLLGASMGKDVYGQLLELMPYLQDDVATTIVVTELIADYLETTTDVMLPEKVDLVILQNVLKWIHSGHLNVRWTATRIFLMLARNPANCGIINQQLINLVDSSNFYIKNLVMQQLPNTPGIKEKTKEYILSSCKNDPHFVVRLVCSDVERRLSL